MHVDVHLHVLTAQHGCGRLVEEFNSKFVLHPGRMAACMRPLVFLLKLRRVGHSRAGQGTGGVLLLCLAGLCVVCWVDVLPVLLVCCT